MSSAKAVRYISTTKVRPASYIDDERTDTHKRIDLNPLDLLFLTLSYMQKGFLFAKQQGEVTKAEKISHLKTSLSHTLDHFFPLAGRLGIEKHADGNTISVHINCNFEGAEFFHATADISVQDIVSPTYVPQTIIDQLFSLTGLRNCEGQSHPLLSIQVTELIDGVFIGCSANHSVCDGTSFWQFINSWSEITNSSTKNHTSCSSPVFERWFIKETDCPVRLPFSFTDKYSTKRNTTNTEDPPLDGLVERCFRFTKTNIAALKERACLEIISKTKQKVEISSLQALLACVWIAVIRARSCLNDNCDERREHKAGLLMNNRTKLIPPLPETYFGNSISWGIVTLKEGELVERGIGYLASLLKEVVNSNNFEKSRKFMESFIEKPFVSGDPGDITGIIPNMFLARSSHRFNMYGNDFGWGCPIAIKTGPNGKFNGLTTVNPGPVEGSVDIEICLPVEVFKAMESDAEFMEAFST